ncbi:MAG TPA: biotin transporter BioY [Candidatus Limnocylindria bacterium]|jgi:biotin transport system substrate-specific component|nr:biotin transporter BioY [Candidatus Limnocylindria bacterium]
MTTTALRPRVLADLVPGGAVRDVALVGGAAALTGLAAQVVVPLPFTPIPVSLQTLTVLLAAAALGPWRAGAAMSLYLIAGVAGVPWFAEQRAGMGFPSLGYVLGFVVAAAVVGWLARRGADRSILATTLTMAAGNLVIYAIGVPYLALAINVELPTAIGLGLTPFLVGDALKILLAAGLLPAAWRLAGDRR